jgi:uncharacterized membrane protein YfcA
LANASSTVERGKIVLAEFTYGGKVAPTFPRYIVDGVGVGTLSGFFGIGGGFLIVPGIMAATGMPLIFAIGSSLLSVAAFGLITATNYATFAGVSATGPIGRLVTLTSSPILCCEA